MNRIKHTYILEDPFDDPSQLSELIPDASPEGKPKDEVRTLSDVSYLYFKRSYFNVQKNIRSKWVAS